MSEKAETYLLHTAESVAYELVALLAPACNQIKVAGSIRRQKSHVHDIDLVLDPKWEHLVNYDLFGVEIEDVYNPIELNTLLQLARPEFVTALDINPRIIKFESAGIPVELYLAEPDGANFEALLQMRTGSAEFNRGMAARAQDRRLHYKAGYGIYRLTASNLLERVDDGTEAGIFAALKMAWVDPEKRN